MGSVGAHIIYMVRGGCGADRLPSTKKSIHAQRELVHFGRAEQCRGSGLITVALSALGLAEWTDRPASQPASPSAARRTSVAPQAAIKRVPLRDPHRITQIQSLYVELTSDLRMKML